MYRVLKRFRASTAAILIAAVGGLPGPVAAQEDIDPHQADIEPQPADIQPLAVRSLLLDVEIADATLLAAGDRGHILVSTDGAASWTQSPAPVRSMITAVELHASGNGWAVGHDALILHTEDAGATWELQNWDPELEQPLFDTWFEDDEHGIAIGAYGLFYETTDGGENWEQRPVDDTEPHFYALSRAGSGMLYMAGEFGSIYRSADAAQTWEKLESPYRGSFFGVLALADESVLVYGLRGNLFRSEDQGDTWEKIDSGLTSGLFGGVQLDDGRIVLVGQSGMLVISEDGGRTFRATNFGSRDSLAAAVPYGAGGVLMVGEGGVHRLDALPGAEPTEAGP